MAGYGQGLAKMEKEKVENADYYCITNGENVESTYMWTITNFNSFEDSLQAKPLMSATWKLKKNGAEIQLKLTEKMNNNELYMNILNNGSRDIQKLFIRPSINRADLGFPKQITLNNIKAGTQCNKLIYTFTTKYFQEELIILIKVTELMVSLVQFKN